MVNIGELLKRPISDKQWPAKIAIGGVVSIVPILQFCAFGYIVNLIKQTLKKEEAILPEWTNWGKLFTDGIIYFVIVLVYMIIPCLIFGMGMALGGINLGILSMLFRAIVIFLSSIVALAATFILPMAICHYVATEDLKSAFSWKEIQERIKAVAKEYGTAYLITLGLHIAVWICCMLLSFIFIGPIIAPFLSFYLGIVIMRMFAEIYPQNLPDKE